MSIALSIDAAKEIHQIIHQQGLSKDSVRLRVGVKGEGPNRKYILDLTERQEATDKLFSSQGIAILCAEDELETLEGAKIDFRKEDAVGSGFTVDVPPKRHITREDADMTQPPPSEEKVREALYQVDDPEVGVNVMDLGLVYGMEIVDRDVKLTMTMTTPACPMEGMIRQNVNESIRQYCPGTSEIEVKIVWEPKWSQDSMTEEGKRQLGWA